MTINGGKQTKMTATELFNQIDPRITAVWAALNQPKRANMAALLPGCTNEGLIQYGSWLWFLDGEDNENMAWEACASSDWGRSETHESGIPADTPADEVAKAIMELGPHSSEDNSL
jgi:hypothetical protein